MAGMPLRSLNEFGEALVRLARALLHPHFVHAVTVLDRLVDKLVRDFRLAVKVFEHDRFENHMTAHFFPLERKDEPLRRYDVVIDTAKAETRNRLNNQ